MHCGVFRFRKMPAFVAFSMFEDGTILGITGVVNCGYSQCNIYQGGTMCAWLMTCVFPPIFLYHNI
ncbi:hypothetical protein BDV39DRAFT_176825 [Aspergillus sergii]|uniref:Uncharacterized protein n=1 Tax=Aspergillus sergii TaxID=1034303 RepID=A0A5N6X3E5_9EURO|nr:hypothetical protein BDV39DRAFT_176825 [Aspergillus sergii]